MTDASQVVTISKERPASTFSGYLMLLAFFVVLAIAGWVIYDAVSAAPLTKGEVLALVLELVGLFIVELIFVCGGFYVIQPNQAVVITLFGAYRGTDRTEGLRWNWFWMGTTKLSVRANNIVSEKLKVNDLRGNPVEIASNVVWRVSDTAQAVFDVEDYKQFVIVQIEAGIRAIGSRYPYDDIEHQEITLRGSHDQVNAELRNEINNRLAVAGIAVDECGITHLAYAPEIAGAMLRRQQAEAVIAARKKLVEGAVTMVEMALQQLSEKDVVQLDDERRAAMVSNLMVVLCGERDTQPVVNAGTLYQ